MIRKSIMLGLAMSLAVGAAQAASPSTEEKAGVGVGAIVGAVAGGPVGAIVGAAVGAKIGDEFFQRNDKVDQLSASLAASESRGHSLEKNIAALNGELRGRDEALQQAREMAKPELVALLAAGIEMDLLFRTDEDVLSGVTVEKLGQLAASLVANPDIRIRLDGYADERGDEIYNQELSARRVRHVRDVLVTAGIPEARISVTAHGESPAAEQTVDSFALERRVSMTLYTGETPSFASNPR